MPKYPLIALVKVHAVCKVGAGVLTNLSKQCSG